MGLIAKLLIFFAGVLGSLLATEFKEWTPRMVTFLIACAVSRLPRDRQERFREEWTSHVNEVPGYIGKLVVAFGFLAAAARMRLFLSSPHTCSSPNGNRDPHLRERGRRIDIVATLGSIGRDLPIAFLKHRLLAAAVDAGMVMLGVGVFLAILYLSGCNLVLSNHRESFALLAGVTGVIWLFYRALWCLADSDTFGMRYAGLRLVDFDGRPADREQRGIRQVAGLLSLLSGGLGIVWALVDNEALTWHDHISKTFLTHG